MNCGPYNSCDGDTRKNDIVQLASSRNVRFTFDLSVTLFDCGTQTHVTNCACLGLGMHSKVHTYTHVENVRARMTLDLYVATALTLIKD